MDAKVNRLAQKAAEKAKTGPVSAPQASFLTSGLPDVGEGSASSTPSQTQPETDKSPDESKPIDPTVDNIEVADMDIEDDSDDEKSDTSEEASAEDPKSSTDQTSNSTESPDSQPAQSTPQELENTPVISAAVSTAPAQPLVPSVRAMMPVQGSLLPGQPPIVTPQPAVGMVIRPFMGVQGFSGPAPRFRPAGPPMQPVPGVVRNPLLQPSGTLPGHGQMPNQGQPFPQIPRPAGLRPTANVPIPRGMGTIQTFPLGTGFVRSQVPLPVAATTVPGPVQMTPNAVPTSKPSQDSGTLLQGVVNVGSPDSEASAPSPVGSPELHLEEGDETPETTPAPLGNVDVNDKTGFETNESFLENPVKNPTTSLGIGLSGTLTVAKPFSGPPSSSNSTPSTPDQFGGQLQDASLAQKENEQKVTAVDILAQLLSRGRKLKETTDQGTSHSTPMSVNQPAPVAAPEAPKENSGKPQSKPLLSLIDSLFPKLSDSIKTLKEKEKVGSSSEAQSQPPNMQIGNTPSSLPARPLPSEAQFQGPSGVLREPPFQQTGLRSILKKGPKKDQEMLEFESNHADVQGVHNQGPREAPLSSNFSEEIPTGMPVQTRPEFRDDAQSGLRHGHDLRVQQSNRLGPKQDAPLPSPTSHVAQPGAQFHTPPVRGTFPQFSNERPFERPPEMLPHGPTPFGRRGSFHGPRGPPFDQSRGSTGPPFVEGPPDMHGPPHMHLPRGRPFERHPEGPADMPARVPTDHLQHGRPPRGPPDMHEQVSPHGPPLIHPPRGPPLERHLEGPQDIPRREPTDQPPHVKSPRGAPDIHEQIPPHGPPHFHLPRGPPFERHPEGPPDIPGRLHTDQTPHGNSPRGPPDMHEQVPSRRPPHASSPRGPPGDMSEKLLPVQSSRGHSPGEPLKDGPPRKISDTSHVQSTEDPVPSLGGPSKPSDALVEEKRATSNEEGTYVNGPPAFRRPSREGPPHVPHEQVPGNNGPPPHRASFPGVMDNLERRREFEHWEDSRREPYRDHARGPWDVPYDRPGLPPPDWRAPPVSPSGDSNRADFREEDPSMWTSFESPGKPPGRRMDFPNRTHEGFREGPADFDRFRDYGPPGRRRHSVGDFEGDWMRYPGPLKRPGPPPVPFPGPSKRPYY